MKRYKQDGVVDAVPVLLKFESAAAVPTNTYRLLSNIVLKIFYFLSENYNCNPLKEYLIVVKESRNEKKFWCNVLDLNGHAELELSADISDLIDESSLSVMMDPISSAKVVDCLCQIEPLAHEFPDLHKRLTKEYPPKATDDGDDEGKEEEWRTEVEGNQKLYKPRSVLRFDSLGENEEDKKRGTYEDFKAILEGKDVNIKRVSLSSLGEIPKWPKGSQEFSKFLDELIPEYALSSLNFLPSLNTDIDEFWFSNVAILCRL
ncbi:hypothetical protein BKA69DRAFT_296356 [Paraphysoderma sedebokerense]|nr:hypothetical protein BKA69DRAFT_296356 [Paraphysoderma sedebokerense]